MKARGFTLVELLVVMAIIATLLSIVAPRYFEHVERAKENTLRQDLAVMRDAIDKFHADANRYPDDLQELVDKHYIKHIPVDPITGEASTWTTALPEDADRGIVDVHSGAEGSTRDGALFAEL